MHHRVFTGPTVEFLIGAYPKDRANYRLKRGDRLAEHHAQSAVHFTSPSEYAEAQMPSKRSILWPVGEIPAESLVRKCPVFHVDERPHSRDAA
jgi:hypothetical protein